MHSNGPGRRRVVIPGNPWAASGGDLGGGLHLTEDASGLVDDGSAGEFGEAIGFGREAQGSCGSFDHGRHFFVHDECDRDAARA